MAAVAPEEIDLSEIVQVSTRVPKSMRIRLRRAAADRDIPIQDAQKIAFEDWLSRNGY
jgi:hypothetical protein